MSVQRPSVRMAGQRRANKSRENAVELSGSGASLRHIGYPQESAESLYFFILTSDAALLHIWSVMSEAVARMEAGRELASA